MSEDRGPVRRSSGGPVVEYFPDRPVVRGWLSLWQEIFSETQALRRLTWRFFLREFSAMYRQSILGYFWAFFVPLFSVLLFIYLDKAGLFEVGDSEVAYPVFAVAGMAFWQLFSRGLLASSGSLVAAGGMIAKINFRRDSLVFASLGTGLVFFGIQLVAALILLLAFGSVPSVSALLVIPAVLPILLFTASLGLMFSLLYGLFRDLGSVLPYLITFLLFATPVLYQRPDTGLARTVADYNPLFYLIATPRDLLLFGHFSHPLGFGLSALMAFVLFALAWQSFHLAQVRIAERI